MTGEFFGSAAAYAQRKRMKGEQLHNGAPVTMENNALADLIRENKAKEEAEARRAKEWQATIAQTFAEIAALSNLVGRNVKEITYNGEVAFVVRDTEAVRKHIGKIRDMRDLQRAVAALTACAMGC